MIYMVTITAEDGSVIELGKEVTDANQSNTITDVEIFLDTSDENSSQKSLGMLAKIKICGKILDDSADSKKKCNALFNWAKALEKNQWYREVVVEILTDSENVFRTYRFEKMFVVDYKENYSKANRTNEASFELKLTQQENWLHKIETY